MAPRGSAQLRLALAQTGAAETVLVEALEQAVSDSRLAKVTLEQLRAAAVRRDSSVAAGGGGRRRLAAALAALEAAGTVKLPATAAEWDVGLSPRLPTWVRRVAPARARPTVGSAADVLPPEIVTALPAHAVAALQGLLLGQTDVEVLTAVARWLRAGGADRSVVPLRERSLQVFGDEKRIDRLFPGRLSGAGVLSLELLRAEAVPVPFVNTWVPGRAGGPPRCVVAENHHTWMSLVRAARASATRHHGVHVGYGAGNQFPSGVQGVSLLEPAVDAVSYFGDLDVNGLKAPVRAAAVARSLGLPPVLPALGLYRRLIRSGVRRDAGSPVDAGTAQRLTSWLGELAEPAAELLAAGVWLPQESVGTELLAGSDPISWV